MTRSKIRTSGAEGLTLSSTALTVANGLTLTDGDIALASGHGVSFASSSDVSGMTSELLNDYEEGTFSASHAGYQISNSGAYTKIGRMVHFAIDLTAHSGASSNLHFFYGLPFTAAGRDCGVAMGYASGSDIPRAYVEQSTDRVYLRNSDGTGNANLGASTRVGVAGTYAT